MMVFWVFYGIFIWVANIIFCGQLADKKNQNVVGWCFLGAILPGLAVIAIAGWPYKAEFNSSKQTPDNKPTQVYWEDKH
jgi:hypothetical protein